MASESRGVKKAAPLAALLVLGLIAEKVVLYAVRFYETMHVGKVASHLGHKLSSNDSRPAVKDLFSTIESGGEVTRRQVGRVMRGMTLPQINRVFGGLPEARRMLKALGELEKSRKGFIAQGDMGPSRYPKPNIPVEPGALLAYVQNSVWKQETERSDVEVHKIAPLLMHAMHKLVKLAEIALVAFFTHEQIERGRKYFHEDSEKQADKRKRREVREDLRTLSLKEIKKRYGSVREFKALMSHLKQVRSEFSLGLPEKEFYAQIMRRAPKSQYTTVSKDEVITATMSEVKKTDSELRIAWGEVYAPNVPDSQGDYMTADEIRKMAHRFMENGRQHKVDCNHDNKEAHTNVVVESFIARKDDQTFIPESWVVGVHVPDQSIWESIKKGEINGFSLQARAMRSATTSKLEVLREPSGMVLAAHGHTHSFNVSFSDEGRFIGGETSFDEGHAHAINGGTVTEPAGATSHIHRYSVIG
jgi:hypothetical protein